MSEESIFTDIGILKWNMDTPDAFIDIESHLKDIRPTSVNDLLDKSVLIVRDHILRNTDTSAQGVIYPIFSALQMLKHNDVDGNVLLHLRMEQLNKDVKIRCTAYKEIA